MNCIQTEQKNTFSCISTQSFYCGWYHVAYSFYPLITIAPLTSKFEKKMQIAYALPTA